MAKVPPPVHTRWKPGQSGNKNGRPKGLLTSNDIKDLISKFANKTIPELQEIVADPKSKVIDVAVASSLIKASLADRDIFDFVLNRSIGKVKEEIDVHSHSHRVLPTVEEAKQILAGDLKGDDE